MAGGAGGRSPSVPDGNSSQWTINWSGLVALVLIASLTLVTWRWLAGSDDDSSQNLSIVGTSAPTVSSEPAPTTRPSATTVSSAPPTTRPTTTTVASEAQIRIRGEMRSCRYGANCLVAGFTIDGFDEHPGRFTCIYPNSRSEFSFNNDGVDEACLTADRGDTITIEIDGVRSATISEQDLDGE